MVLVGTLISSSTVSAEPKPGNAAVGGTLAVTGLREPGESIESLHRQGEERFDAGDYGGARESWTGAYDQVEPGEETWPYRATLLSLIVTTSVSEFSSEGDRDTLRQVATMVDDALEADLDPEIRTILEEERERLTPYLDPPPSPREAEPELPAPAPQPEPRKPLVPTPVWIGGGATLLAGGLAAVIAGSRFRPRAIDLVESAGDSRSASPGREFIADEQAKGTGWMVAGGLIATAGATALVIGLLRLTRAR